MRQSKPNDSQPWSQHHPLLSTEQEQASRVFILLVITTMTIGSHYGKHSISSLSSEIMTLLGSNRTEYGLLFSSQQLPGIILPVFGGFALTYIPYGPAAVFLASSITFATTICALAVSRRSYGMLILGRFLFGLFDGALTTLQGAIVATTLRHHVGAGFGIMLFVSRMSSFAGLTIPALISRTGGLELSMWFTVIICLPPLLSTIVYAVKPFRHGVNSPAQRSRLDMNDLWEVVKSLGLSFWCISYLWIVVAGVVFSMTHFIPDAAHTHFHLNAVRSGLLSGSLVLAAAICSPVFGILQDRTGRRATILTCCCVSLFFGSALCAAALSNSNVIGVPQKWLLNLGLIFAGIGFSAAPVTLLAGIALVVDETTIAAALGVYKAAENGALALIHPGIGMLRDWSGEYVLSFLLLGALSLSGVWISFRLVQNGELDKCHDRAQLV